MAAVHDGEVKTHFLTKEGEYSLVPEAGLVRPSKLPYTTIATLPVRLSFVKLGRNDGADDRVMFNVDREINFYTFCGVAEEAGPNQNIDKRLWKAIRPTCHDINPLTRSPLGVDVVVGLQKGPIHIFDPIRHEMLWTFNDPRQIDKTDVTDIRWVPGSDTLFVAAHQSGCLYVYNRDLPSSSHPHYMTSFQGQTYTVLTNRSKGKNPMQKWTVGFGGLADMGTLKQQNITTASSSLSNSSAGNTVCESHAINEMAFSPDCKHLAVASQDGFMRVFDFELWRMVGAMRSYFGGVTCVSWSPDGQYVVAGSQDDLVAVWSFSERQLIARGIGHSSFVCRVAFDPYTTSISCRSPPSLGSACNGKLDGSLPKDSVQPAHLAHGDAAVCKSSQEATLAACKMTINGSARAESSDVSSDKFYRFGSVGHDSDLLLWDLGGDVLSAHQISGCGPRSSSGLMSGQSLGVSAPETRGQSSAANSMEAATGDARSETVDGSMEQSGNRNSPVGTNNALGESSLSETSSSTSRSSGSSHPWKRAGTLFRHSKTKSIANSGGGSAGSGDDGGCAKVQKKNVDSSKNQFEVVEVPPIIGIREVPLIPYIVHKKISHERLTDIAFREDCVVTAAQDGVIKCWARPRPPEEPPASEV